MDRAHGEPIVVAGDVNLQYNIANALGEYTLAAFLWLG
jgi:hypothetical protein